MLKGNKTNIIYKIANESLSTNFTHTQKHRNIYTILRFRLYP